MSARSERIAPIAFFERRRNVSAEANVQFAGSVKRYLLDGNRPLYSTLRVPNGCEFDGGGRSLAFVPLTGIAISVEAGGTLRNLALTAAAAVTVSNAGTITDSTLNGNPL